MRRMIDFISGFFTWAELDEEPIEVREEVVEPKEETLKSRKDKEYLKLNQHIEEE